MTKTVTPVQHTVVWAGANKKAPNLRNTVILLGGR